MSDSESEDLSSIRPSENLNFIHKFKIILVGNSYVGKTSLVMRFAEGIFQTDYSASISVDFKTQKINLDDDNTVDLRVWDTCGHEKFRSITNQYYKEVDGALLVYDIVNMGSFIELDQWYYDLKKLSPKDAIIMLVGNKIDLEGQRQVDKAEAEKYAESKGIKYFEISAKTNENVEVVFKELGKEMLVKRLARNDKSRREKEVSLANKTVDLSLLEKQNSFIKPKEKSCCD